MRHRDIPSLPAWFELASLTVLSIYFYVFMEWFFYVTKPSFMSLLPFVTRLGILLLPALLFAAVCLGLLLVLFIASRFPGLRRSPRLFLAAGSLVPAAFLATTALMMVDNFTYTIFKFGVVSTKGVLRGMYGLLFLALLAGFTAWAARRVLKHMAQKSLNPAGKDSAGGILAGLEPALKNRLYASAALLALSIPLGGSLFLSTQSANPAIAVGEPTRRPNILLIGSDGVNVDQMSINGNTPDTTPFLREFAEGALLSLNNFTNANITSGSLASMFTGKLPTQTRMLYPPDVLRGNDAFQHLPGILKKAGYYNAEISVDYYADPDMLNLQDGFVMINGRSATIGRLYTASRRFLPENAAYFLSMIAKRLADRLMHIYYLRTMPNPYAEVTQQLSNMSDSDRLGMIRSLFNDIRQPLFIHAHLMGTHTNEDDDYQQGIIEFDQYMRELVNELDQMGRLEETVIILYTDHGHNNSSNVRTPLMFWFPNGEYTRKITSNTQNLDIAPTVLEYMGIQPPTWMAGKSLLQDALPATRPIFTTRPNYRVEIDDRLQLDTSKTKPPFYQFGVVSMIVCQNWYTLETDSLTWKEGEVEGYPTPCKTEDLPSLLQAQELILEQLEKDGFDTTTAKGSTNK